MIKIYEFNGRKYRYEEGTQPEGAILLEKAEPVAETKVVEPKTKVVKPRTKTTKKG